MNLTRRRGDAEKNGVMGLLLCASPAPARGSRAEGAEAHALPRDIATRANTLDASASSDPNPLSIRPRRHTPVVPIRMTPCLRVSASRSLPLDNVARAAALDASASSHPNQPLATASSAEANAPISCVSASPRLRVQTVSPLATNVASKGGATL